MLNITEEQIKKICSKRNVYEKGLQYYFMGRVKELAIDESGVAKATVMGAMPYEVSISGVDSEEGGFVHCSCPSFDGEGGCKHIVATFKAVQAYQRNLDKIQVEQRKDVDKIFDYFYGVTEESYKKEINLVVTFESVFDKRNWSFSNYIFASIGEKKLYVVRNIKKLIESIDTGDVLEFGKGFIFDPKIHGFSETNTAIINIFREVLEIDELIQDNSRYYYGSGSMIDGKKILLTKNMTEKFLRMFEGQTIDLLLNDVKYTEVPIIKQPLPMEMDLKESGNELQLILQNEKVTPLVKDVSFVFYNHIIYELDEKQKKFLIPFIQYATKNATNLITIQNNKKQTFMSEVLPVTAKNLEIKIDESLTDKVLSEPFKASIYFDLNEANSIFCRVEFVYGSYHMNPFSAEEFKSDKIILRDMEKERKIQTMLELSEFKVAQGILFLDDEEKIPDFIYQILPKLHTEADIYYSESFKQIKIRESKKITTSVSYNEKSEMLDISFDYENVDSKELSMVFASIREKKKYHRLKDGSYIPLSNINFSGIHNILDYMDIKEKNIGQAPISLPLSRAMYLEEQLSDNETVSLHTNMAFDRLIKDLKNPKEMDFPLPEALDGILRDYQKTGFRWLKTLSYYKLGGILADDMGLGKTIQTIAFIKSELEKTKGISMVVCPSSLVYNWLEEINKFAGELRVTVVQGNQSTRQGTIEQLKETDIVVTSYPLIRRDIELYSDITFDYCFLDEAQHIKNPESQNAKAVKRVKAKGYFALTGTPIENSLMEMWSIFDFIMPGYLLSRARFIKKYELPIIKEQSESTMEQLVRQIKPFILRRMKTEVLKELPEKIETKISIELTDEQKKIYLAYLENIRNEIESEMDKNGLAGSHIKIIAALTRLRQICCHPALFMENYTHESGKLNALNEILLDALEGGHRILIFSQFTSMLEIIKKQMEDDKVQYFYLDGKTPVTERLEMVKRFNNGEREVFLISLKAGGTGLNLTGADTVIHYDPWWNPAVEEQATDRAYRIGQTNIVQVFKLITKGTIEEKIYELQNKKKKIIDAVIKPGENMINKLTTEDVRELFR